MAQITKQQLVRLAEEKLAVAPTATDVSGIVNYYATIVLTEGDPLLTGRLKSSEAPTRALNELFAKLTDAELEALLSNGVLSWTNGDLTKPRIKLLDTILRDLNTRSGADPYLLSPAIAARTGFAVVRVPGVEDPVISWWVSSPAAAYPAWIPLVNQQGVAATGYHRSHLEQIPGGS